MVPLTAEQIEDFDCTRRQLYKVLVALGDIIEAHGGPKTPIPWVPTRKLVPQGVNLELARLDDAPPHMEENV